MGQPRELSAQEDTNRRMLRARDEMDRRYAEPLDVPALAAIAHLSASQFGRVFKDVYGETPHRYLQSSDVHATYAALRDAGVEITQEPVEQPYGTDFGIRDPFGNHVRISQPNAATPDDVRDTYEASHQ